MIPDAPAVASAAADSKLSEALSKRYRVIETITPGLEDALYLARCVDTGTLAELRVLSGRLGGDRLLVAALVYLTIKEPARGLSDHGGMLKQTGTAPGLLPVNLYFDDKSGLLVRVVRWNQTLVGPVPSEINYGDYRTVAGIQMPFTWTATQTYMQMTITLREVSVNVPVDASRFAKPREFRAGNR